METKSHWITALVIMTKNVSYQNISQQHHRGAQVLLDLSSCLKTYERFCIHEMNCHHILYLSAVYCFNGFDVQVMNDSRETLVGWSGCWICCWRNSTRNVDPTHSGLIIISSHLNYVNHIGMGLGTIGHTIHYDSHCCYLGLSLSRLFWDIMHSVMLVLVFFYIC